MTMTGCSKNESKEHTVIDYTVVENEDLPAELRKLIDNKKEIHCGLHTQQRIIHML